ncbi:MAG TPA: PAS domain S-box protein, partial [Pseudoduganella sp.]
MAEHAISRCQALARLAQGQQGEALAATLRELEDALAALRARPAIAAAPELEMDLAGYITAWNAGVERMFGYTAAEALGQHILFLYTDDDEGGNIAELVLEKDNAVTEVRRRKKSGEVIWVRAAISLAHDEGGNAVGMRVKLSPVNEGLSPEEKNSLHARIIEDSDQGVLITDARERIVSINGAFTRITGYTPAEAIGQTPDLLRSGVHDAEF